MRLGRKSLVSESPLSGGGRRHQHSRQSACLRHVNDRFRPIADIEATLHPSPMFRPAVALSLFVVACSAPAPIPRSLCDLPRNLAGWSGHEVRWRGLLLTSHHGAAFISEDCQRRGVPIVGLSQSADARFRSAVGTGWFETELTAKVGKRGLYVTTFHKLEPIDGTEGERRSERLGF